MPSIPLFPLSTLLLPGMRMPLQIFEQRYLAMVSDCLKSDSGFGVVLIREGHEVGEVPQVFSVGVYGRIVDWDKQTNGLLGITVLGERKFRTVSMAAQPDKLLMAEVEFLPDEPVAEIEDRHMDLVALAQQLSEHPAVARLGLPTIKDASTLGWQLTQLLPLSNPDKVALLEMDDPLLRLDELDERVQRLSE